MCLSLMLSLNDPGGDMTQCTILPSLVGQTMKKLIPLKLISRSTWTNMSGGLIQWYFTIQELWAV